ncbi:hypothetical protein FKP32DRAFT_122663 [Trametes sanguinea]|nr:hypothetical protein FKP32DRAFT_122663 [Trametes sanguinea]
MSALGGSAGCGGGCGGGRGSERTGRGSWVGRQVQSEGEDGEFKYTTGNSHSHLPGRLLIHSRSRPFLFFHRPRSYPILFRHPARALCLGPSPVPSSRPSLRPSDRPPRHHPTLSVLFLPRHCISPANSGAVRAPRLLRPCGTPSPLSRFTITHGPPSTRFGSLTGQTRRVDGAWNATADPAAAFARPLAAERLPSRREPAHFRPSRHGQARRRT